MPLKRFTLFASLAAIGMGALAAEPGLILKQSTTLRVAAPGEAGREALPVFVDADNISGATERYVEASGKVIARRLDESLSADWMRYDQAEDRLHAQGNVVLTRGRGRVEGDELQLQLATHLGEMRPIRYESQQDEKGQYLRGDAGLLQFEGEDRYHFSAATYTSCPTGNDDWLLRTDDLKLDYTANIGAARNVRVEYLGTPILYAPWMDFGLDNKRKSGFLTPTVGASDKRGVEIAAPWYWNIAPNHDATVTPRYMSKRGTQLGTEFRYLDDAYTGKLNFEYLPNDQIAERDRYLSQILHNQQFDARWAGSLNITQVSDDKYFTNLSSAVHQTAQANLLREGTLSYNGGWWAANGRVQTYQTLGSAPLFSRLPQITLTARQQTEGYPLDIGLTGEFVRYTHALNSQPEGDRVYAYPSIKFPFTTSYAYITPKFGWHLTRYDLDRAAPGGVLQETRSLPIFTLDAGLEFEREFAYAGSPYVQTLEPRLYYVRIPYQDQSKLPVFDSALLDSSLYTIFSENQYAGIDRINDANQVTMALTTRLLDNLNGIERLQLTVGQRYYFSDQRITLPGQAMRNADSSDVLAILSGQVTNRLRLSGNLQHNADNGETARFGLGAFYRDGPGRLFNADYRYAQGSLEQIDMSAQWPLAAKWYGVGRLNYSFRDSRVVEALGGFEYNAGCWSLRSVMHRLALTQTETSNAFFIQLELRDLTKLGPNPLDLLKRSIPGYAKSDEFNLP